MAVARTVSHVDNIPGPETATATQTDGAGNVATDSATITISPVGPHNNAAPTITNGSAPADGDTLVYGPGSWTGNPTPTVSHVWQRCNPTCQSTGQTGSSYLLTAADVGASIRVEETASNDGGIVVVDSLETPDVAPTLDRGADPQPECVAAVADGVTLTAAAPSSSWDDATGLTFTYDFQRCSPGCVDVQNGTSNQYVLQNVDVGTRYQVVVVATAGTATATATSSQTAVVAPKSTAAPTLSGVTQDGQVLTASSPSTSWDSATGLTRTFVFTRCDANGANCNTTVQTTTVTTSTTTYTLTAADMGSRIRVTVSASKGGSASVASAPSTVTAIIAPFSTGAPATPTVVAPDTLVQDGVTLQASNGSWLDSGSLAFSYQWSQCTSTCSPIGGATGSTYVLKATDVGTHIQVAVTASAGQGATSVTSGQTVLVQPLNTAAPSITLPTVQGDGQTFTAVEGGWDGASDLTFTYQWKRCTANGGSCSPISLATGSTYTAGAADVGHALRLAVSASKNGSAATTSPDSSQTNALAPLSTGAPALTGAPQDTATITADSPASDWDGVSGLTQSYKFSRCDSGRRELQHGGADRQLEHLRAQAGRYRIHDSRDRECEHQHLGHGFEPLLAGDLDHHAAPARERCPGGSDRSGQGRERAHRGRQRQLGR